MQNGLYPKLSSINFSGFEGLMREYDAIEQDVYFLQVGANDGVNGDPLFPLVNDFGWKGILIEPQKNIFETKLVPAYAGQSGLILENVAISEKEGPRLLYYLTCSTDRWATGLASFERKHLEKHIECGYVSNCLQLEESYRPDNVDEWIGSDEVMCITFNGLLDKHRPKKLDLLQIDAEGYDYQLLKTFDLDRYCPSAIQYEGYHLSRYDEYDCATMLHQRRYDIFCDGLNRVAVLRKVLDRLGR